VPTEPEIAQVATSSREFRKGDREFQSECRRLGMNAVRAADRGGEFILPCAAFERGLERVHVGNEQIGGTHELDVEASIQNVRRRHSLMYETRLRPDDFGEVGEEGDDVMLDLPLDLVDVRGVELRRVAFLPDRLRRLLRDQAELGHGVGGMGLDLEPDAKPRLRRPDRRHLRTRIAGYGHAASPRTSAAALRMASMLRR
jgi:hypothetical protein